MSLGKKSQTEKHSPKFQGKVGDGKKVFPGNLPCALQTNTPCLAALQSIDIAHENMKKGRLFINRGTVENSQINRSPFSYLANPESERNR